MGMVLFGNLSPCVTKKGPTGPAGLRSIPPRGMYESGADLTERFSILSYGVRESTSNNSSRNWLGGDDGCCDE